MKIIVSSLPSAIVLFLSAFLSTAIPIIPSLSHLETKSINYGVYNDNVDHSIIVSPARPISDQDKIPIVVNDNDIHSASKPASLARRARFPTIKIAIIRTVNHSNVIPILLTQAWDWVVEYITLNPEDKPRLLSAVECGFTFAYGGFEVSVRNLMETGGISLQDLLTVLASAHDQMDERLGFGTGILHIYNGAKMIATGLIVQHGGALCSNRGLIFMDPSHSAPRSLSARAPPRVATWVEPTAQITGSVIPSLLNGAARRVYDIMYRYPFGLIPQDATGFLYRTADYAIQFVVEVGQEVTWTNINSALSYTWSYFAGTAKWGLAEIKLYYKSTLIATGRIFSTSSGSGGARRRRDVIEATASVPPLRSGLLEKTSDLVPRVIPGVFPGPNPPDIHIDLNGSLQVVARGAIQALLYEVYSTLSWQLSQRPLDLMPEEGFARKSGKYVFSIVPREGIRLNWRMAYQAFSLVSTIQQLQGYGLGRFDVTNGPNRLVAIAYVFKDKT